MHSHRNTGSKIIPQGRHSPQNGVPVCVALKTLFSLPPGCCQDLHFSIFSVLMTLVAPPNHTFLETSSSQYQQRVQYQSLKTGQNSVHKVTFCKKQTNKQTKTKTKKSTVSVSESQFPNSGHTLIPKWRVPPLPNTTMCVFWLSSLWAWFFFFFFFFFF